MTGKSVSLSDVWHAVAAAIQAVFVSKAVEHNDAVLAVIATFFCTYSVFLLAKRHLDFPVT